MKFLLRSLLVLAVAVACGIVLYYAVQALPGGSQTSNPPGARLETPAGGTAPQNLPARPERSENGRGGGFRWRSILNVAKRVIMFSALVFAAVLAKNFIFERKSKGKNTSD